ncbi:glycerophosphodiester phosphodiesterase family protein [Pedobacter endophyticus]|uniref:PKD domain-containing protein n=1 Tax=Pedobacter endophyticus TaxID=2789740 RepID=A0A7S9PZ63_9SPHI|nr:glycerophosphodiester phosphodiesterase family protein [Pedobacter endophyticus]QPH39307.1 PKD domain-containing protein [Pedobacter endophyticus]
MKNILLIAASFPYLLNTSCSKEKSINNNYTSGALPVAAFMISEPQSITGKQVSFTDISTDADDDIVTQLWDFADGTPIEQSKNSAHTFSKAGSYLVSLTVKDKTGNTATASKRILIKNTAQPDYGNLIGIKEKIALLYPKAMICAHRTDHENFPENSLGGIQAAIENQVNIVEIDTRLSLDNELVIMHDATTARTTTGNHTIAQKTLNELKQLKLLFNGTPTNYEIPTLKECLIAAKGKVYVDIDASWDNTLNYYNRIYNEVAALNMVNMVFFYTETPAVAKGLLDLDSDVIVLLGAGNDTDWNNANNMNPKAKLWHLAEKTLNANYTSNPFTSGIRFFANAYVNSSIAPPLSGKDLIVDNLINNKVSIIQTDVPIHIKNYLQAGNLWLR